MINPYLFSVLSFFGKEIEFTKELDKFLSGAMSVLIKIVIAFIVFFIGKKVIKWVLRLLERFFCRSQIEKGVTSFLTSLTRIVLYVVLLGVIADILGLKATSFVAVIGSAGLALGLSLQGSLSNLAGGVLILILKPYQVGDYIITMGNEGIVASIDIFYTQLLTLDNRRIVMPNGSLSNSSIINVTHEPTRRLEVDIPVAYETDISIIKEMLSELHSRSEWPVKDIPPEVFINGYDNHAVIVRFRIWVAKENFWNLRLELLENIKTTFDEKGIKIPHNKMDVFMNEHSDILNKI